MTSNFCAISYLVQEALQAADNLGNKGIGAEVIDPRTLKPLDIGLIIDSVRKTRRLVVADGDWPCCSFAEHIATLVYNELFSHLKAPVKCINFPDTPIPASTPLEKVFFPNYKDIVRGVLDVLNR